jgi:MFS family permease
MAEVLSPLRLPGFRHVAGAHVVNELGNWLGEIALAILVFNETGSPLATAALFLGMQFLPAFTAPPLVAGVEAIGPRRSLTSIYAAEAAVFTCLGLLADDFVLAAIIVLAAVDGSLASAARSLTRASAGEMLARRGMLREGNALLNMGFTASAAAGPAIAGLVVAGAGPQAALFTDAASFLVVALVLATAPGLPRIEFETSSWVERLRDGFRYVRGRLVLRRLLYAQGAAFAFFALVLPIEVLFVKETLDAGDFGYGVLLASWGSGMVAGSLLFAAVRRLSLRTLLIASTLAVGLAYLGTAAAPTLLVACVASVIGGAGNGVQWVALISAVQELTSSAYQARVIAMLESLASAMPGLGFVVGGTVAALLSPRASYAVAGIGVLLVLVVGAVALRRAGWTGERPLEGVLPDADLAPVPPEPV